MLILDGILALRLRLLTSALISDNEKLPYLDDFQQELDHYRVWNSSMKLPKQRVKSFHSSRLDRSSFFSLRSCIYSNRSSVFHPV